MDRSRSKHNGFVSTGATSLVLIFVMLALLTFAVLSLVSAQADMRLSQKSADRTTEYYAAENAANDVLTGLLEAADEGRQALADYAAAADVTLTEDGRASYQVPLGQDQTLAVELVLPAGGKPLQVLRWQAVSGYDWSADEPLNLPGPGALPVAGLPEV